jgi:subtilisin family serine protease
VDATHPDLVGRVLPEIDLLPNVTPAPADTAHGTRVASLIAANLDGIGMAGVAPAATILPVAALDPAGVGDSSTVARAIIAAADAGARVINLSLGGPDPDPVLDRACSYAYAKGAVLVAAAGNSYQFGNEVQYPAASPHVVAVAAVDATGTPASFSNTGRHIALAAPGQDVWAAVPGAIFDQQSGTSFAAPHVAGALALVMAANPTLSTPQVVAVTELTAQDDASGNGRDDQLGYGIVRADRAVAASMTMQAAGVAPNARLRLRWFDAAPEPLARGSVATMRVTVLARFTDGVWRPDPVPSLVRFEFRPAGSKRYRQVATVASGADGVAVLSTVPTRSGTWRAKVRQAKGSWSASGTDKLRVRR